MKHFISVRVALICVDDAILTASNILETFADLACGVLFNCSKIATPILAKIIVDSARALKFERVFF